MQSQEISAVPTGTTLGKAELYHKFLAGGKTGGSRASSRSSQSRQSAEPTICPGRRRGNVPTPDLYFLKGLIQSNQFTSLHTVSSSSRSKTRGRRERRRMRLSRSKLQEAASLPSVPSQGMQGSGEAHPDACRETQVAN